MLGESISSIGWPACGEIDIMELVGSKPNTVLGTAHWGLPGNGSTYITKNYALSGTDFSKEYHVFSIVWVKDQIQWYVDDQLYNTITKNDVNVTYPFNSPHFFIFNVAVGGNLPGYPDANTVFPKSMVVDYVRVFQ
jgi:beta-glucanase (GH16 family)